MKKLLITLIIAAALYSCSTELVQNETEQSRTQNTTTENLIVITLDGLRWQEVFGDEDVFDKNFLSGYGGLYGNRDLGNLVNVANPIHKSYSGYHEIFTGNTTEIYNNTDGTNPHNTVFEFIRNKDGYDRLDVQVIGMWSKLKQLFRVNQNTMPVMTGFDINVDDYEINILNINSQSRWWRDMIAEYKPIIEAEAEIMLPNINSFGNQNHHYEELLLYIAARKSLEMTKPKVAYLQFSYSDLYAHNGDWEGYINATKNVGIYIKDLINFLDTQPNYANNTSILITTDHGRGYGDNWKSHRNTIEGSDESWFIILSPNIEKGIVSENKQYYNEQLAQTMAGFLGLHYEAEHVIAEAIEL